MILRHIFDKYEYGCCHTRFRRTRFIRFDNLLRINVKNELKWISITWTNNWKKQSFHGHCKFAMLENVFKDYRWRSGERLGINLSVSISWLVELNLVFPPRIIPSIRECFKSSQKFIKTCDSVPSVTLSPYHFHCCFAGDSDIQVSYAQNAQFDITDIGEAK